MSGFSSCVRQVLAEKAIAPKSVIKLFSPDTKPPKLKRFIIIGISENSFGSVIINTEINEKVYPLGSYFNSLQIALNHFESCKYLDHNSFVDCTYIYKWDKPEVINLLSIKNSDILGMLLESHWTLIKDAIISCRSISPKIKKEFGLI